MSSSSKERTSSGLGGATCSSTAGRQRLLQYKRWFRRRDRVQNSFMQARQCVPKTASEAAE
eukprot:8667967-Alexandrium_andersonii.AAC.1